MQVRVIGGQLTKNFNLSEFIDTFNNTFDVYIDCHFIPFVEMLQEFRDWYNRPINITSAYRSRECNKYYNGSSNSSHLVTNAIDFPLPTVYRTYSPVRKEEFLRNVKSKWCSLCDEYGYFPQVNFYDTYLHLGISKERSSFIDKRSEKYV